MAQARARRCRASWPGTLVRACRQAAEAAAGRGSACASRPAGLRSRIWPKGTARAMAVAIPSKDPAWAACWPVRLGAVAGMADRLRPRRQTRTALHTPEVASRVAARLPALLMPSPRSTSAADQAVTGAPVLPAAIGTAVRPAAVGTAALPAAAEQRQLVVRHRLRRRWWRRLGAEHRAAFDRPLAAVDGWHGNPVARALGLSASGASCRSDRRQHIVKLLPEVRLTRCPCRRNIPHGV